MIETPTLFLDIDDVLCLNKPYGGFDVILALKSQHPDAAAVFASVFDPGARSVLESLHRALDGNLRYVISSTWRTSLKRSGMEAALRRGGLDFVVERLHPVWATSTGFHSLMRIEDIEAWLDDNHQGEPFAVLDDTFSGPSLRVATTRTDHRLSGRVVLCQEGVGLLPEHLAPLLSALRREVPNGRREVH